MRDIAKRMGPDRASPLSASGGAAAPMTERQLETVVRRLGYVASKAHEQMMRNLVESRQAELAEDFNDAFKPVVDFLLHFTVRGGDAQPR